MKRFATRNQTHATRAFIDDRRLHRFGNVILAGGTAGVDQTRPTRKAVQHLVSAKIDRMIRSQLGIDSGIGLPVITSRQLQRIVAPVVLGKLLFDNIGLDGRSDVIGLRGQIGRQMIILLLCLKCGVPYITPKDRVHAELMSNRERAGNLLDLPTRFR